MKKPEGAATASSQNQERVGSRHSRRATRLWAVLRRRGWVLLVATLAVSGVAVAIDARTPARYQAEAVLIVPATVPGQLPPGQPDNAIKLAKTYTKLIPIDDQVIAAGAAAVGVSTQDYAKALTVTNDNGTALIHVVFQADTPDLAVKGATKSAALLTKLNPPGQITNASLRPVKIPDAATAIAGTSTSSAILGAVLGLILGIILAAALERTDRRIDDAETLGQVIQTSSTEWGPPVKEEAAALVHRWGAIAGSPAPVVALVSAGPIPQYDVASVTHLLAERSTAGGLPARAVEARQRPSGGGHLPAMDGESARLLAAGRLGHDEGAELAAQTSDLVVVLGSRGGRARDVEEARDRLAQYGIEVAWALLLPRPHSVAP